MNRICSPVFQERNQRQRVITGLRAAWTAWKISRNCPAGEATWERREFLASIRPDGTLELVEKSGQQREMLLHSRTNQGVMLRDDGRRNRPPIHRRRATCLATSTGSGD